MQKLSYPARPLEKLFQMYQKHLNHQSLAPPSLVVTEPPGARVPGSLAPTAQAPHPPGRKREKLGLQGLAGAWDALSGKTTALGVLDARFPSRTPGRTSL